MNNNAMFSIRLDSFILTGDKKYQTPENLGVLHSISKEGQSSLRSLYLEITQSVRNGIAIQKKVDSQLDGSIFIVCIPDGVVMVKCIVPEKETPRMSGILLRKKESLRMGWRLARWHLIVITAGNILSPGVYYLSMEDIVDKTNSAEFDEKYLSKLVELGHRIMQEEIPVNYAMTNFPLEKLPLDFGDNVVSGYGNEPDDRRSMPININEKGLHPDRDLWHTKYRDTWKLIIFKLVFMPKKEFQKDKEEELKAFDKERRRQEISALRNELTEMPDYFWCIRVGFLNHEGVYTEYLSDNMEARIKKGQIAMSDFLKYAWNAEKNALAFFKEIEAKEKQEEENRERKEREREEKLQEKQKQKEQKKFKKFPNPIDDNTVTEKEKTVDDKSRQALVQKTADKIDNASAKIGGLVSKIFGKK